jgi:hypothetical protein
MLHRTDLRRATASAASCCAATAIACLALWMTPAAASSSVYKWVDASGVVHLSSEKPPRGVKYERMALTPMKDSSGKRQASSSSAGNRLLAASSEQIANRNAVVSELQNRECVVALEAIDRLARSGQAVDEADFRRLQQTADQNCSKDPDKRREQEQMAAKLRVAKGDVCVDARNKLADMLAPGKRPTREQLKNQQEFIEAHCKAPVR